MSAFANGFCLSDAVSLSSCFAIYSHALQGIVQFLHRSADGVAFVVKFFSDVTAFKRELALYQRPELRTMMPAIELIEANEAGRVRCSNGFSFPPFIVVERGESLNEWAQRCAPDGITAMFVLCHVAKRLEMLHTVGLTHRDLKPANILWRPRANAWTLIDFGCAAEIGAAH
jgi:Protein kinase domain